MAIINNTTNSSAIVNFEALNAYLATETDARIFLNNIKKILTFTGAMYGEARLDYYGNDPLAVLEAEERAKAMLEPKFYARLAANALRGLGALSSRSKELTGKPFLNKYIGAGDINDIEDAAREIEAEVNKVIAERS